MHVLASEQDYRKRSYCDPSALGFSTGHECWDTHPEHRNFLGPPSCPFSIQMADNTVDAYDTGGYGQFSKRVRCRMAKYEVANSGNRDHIPGQMEETCYRN